jgi:hypothetical protein
MAKLSDDELRELVAKANPDVEIDDTPRPPKTPPPGIRSLPDRRALSDKVARYRGLAADAELPPLSDDESQFIGIKVNTPEGTLRRSALVSTETGEIIAEQG